MIPFTSVSPVVLRRREDTEIRELRRARHVLVEFNDSDIRAGLLLAWIQPKGSCWWGHVIVVDEGAPVSLAIGASSIRPIP